MKKFTILFLFLSTILFAGCGQNKIQVVWEAPTDGAPTEHYVLIVNHADGNETFETDKTKVTIQLPKGGPYYASVYAVGYSGIEGPISEMSDAFTVH